MTYRAFLLNDLFLVLKIVILSELCKIKLSHSKLLETLVRSLNWEIEQHIICEAIRSYGRILDAEIGTGRISWFIKKYIYQKFLRAQQF